MAVFYLQHTGKGKARYDRQGIINHGRYVMRQRARGLMGARHAPEDYGQFLGWLGSVYDTSRSNARVVDTVIVNLPRELTHAEHAELVRSYLDAVTQGRTPYVFVIHTDKPDNPHAHIIIRDADIETGRRVAGLSKAGSSHRLRALWEAFCNAALRDHGVAISRAGKRARERNNTANTAVGHQRLSPAPAPLPDNAAPTIEPAPSPPEPKGHSMSVVVPFPETKATIDYSLPDIQSVLSTDAELNRLLAVKQQLSQLKGDAKAAQTQLDSVVKRMADLTENITKLTAAHTTAAQTYADYRRWGVFLRGFQAFGWKSPKRVRAERARDNYNTTTEVLEHTSSRLESVRKEHRVLQQFAKKVERTQTQLREADLSYGTDADLRDAEVILRNTLQMYAERIKEIDILKSHTANDITTDEANRLRRVVAQQEIRDGYAH